MKMRNLVVWGLLVNSWLVQAAPLVQNIVNKSDVGYVIVFHSDNSSCSVQNKNLVIEARSYSKKPFLLERHKKGGKSSLILRPLYYQDKATNTKMPLLNQQHQYDPKFIEAAYQAWIESGKKRKFADAQDWLKHWVGGDIHVIPDVLQAHGYLVNMSRIHIYNTIKEHAQWLSFSKGVFSRLMVEIDIVQHDRKGIKPSLKVIAGEGGFCTEELIKKL